MCFIGAYKFNSEYLRRKMQQQPEPEQPSQEPGTEMDQTPAKHNAANTSFQPVLGREALSGTVETLPGPFFLCILSLSPSAFTV